MTGYCDGCGNTMCICDGEVLVPPAVTQRRDNWSREQVRALRKRNRNLRRELLIQAAASRRQRKRYYDAWTREQRQQRKIRRLEKLLVELLEQNQDMRRSLRDFASLITNEEWRQRATKNPRLYLDAVYRRAMSLPNPYLYPTATEAARAILTSNKENVDGTE